MTHYATIDDAIRRGAAADRVPRWALELLRGIAAGRVELAAVRHPLGFLCLPAQRRGEHGVCVHLWTPEFQPTLTTSGVHSHSWDLTSYVLYGTLHNQRVHVAEAPGAATHRIFEVRSRGGVDELHATGRLVSCEPEPAHEHGAGSVYLLPAGEFHSTVVPGSQEVATVVLGRSRPGAADLSVGPLHTRSHVITRSRCSARETARAALLIAGRLEAAGAA